MNGKTYTISSALLAGLLLILCSSVIALPSEDHKNDGHKDMANYLSEGKAALDKGNYENAINLLTSAYEKLPILGDYALMWRARAYEGRDDIYKAASDLRAVRETYRESPLIRAVRKKEIELLRKKNDNKFVSLLDGFIKDYPSELALKYEYAEYLKANKEAEKAGKLFKEIFMSTSPFSKSAFKELSLSEITTEDIIKKAKNLNNAWLFEEAEKYFRDALSKDGTLLKNEIQEGLAYSLFRQKRYREASELYKELNNYYWRARAVLRAGDTKTFEAELSELNKTDDKRNAQLLIVYGTKKRRGGDIDGALKTFKEVHSLYPSAKEEALWTTGWTYYLSKDYKNAYEIFSKMYASYSDTKYLYWKNRCTELSGSPEISKVSFYKKDAQLNNFYTFLSALKENQKLSAVEKAPLKVRMNGTASERIEIFKRLGFKQEAVLELIHMAKKNPTQSVLIYISSNLKELGNYKMAINSISKVPYNEEFHELFYPLGYWPLVEEASRKNELDPFLILSVMREESRFDPEARSIAGAMGLMQLMPQTANRLSKNHKISLKHSSDLYDARTNILIGSYYLKHLLKTFNSIPVAVAAYNAGEDIVKEWLRNGNYSTIDEFIEDIPYNETHNYVKKVMTSYFEYMRANGNIDIPATKKSIGNL